VLKKGKNESRLSYVHLAFADYRFPSVPVEYERAAGGKFNVITREGADARFGRSG